MREISILKQRILEFLEKTGVSKYECYKNTGITNGVFSQSNGMSEDNLLKFLSYYSTVNHTWLLTGQGTMLTTPQSATVSSSLPAADNAFLYNMYKEKEAKVEVQAEEIGALKQQVKTLEKQLNDLGFKRLKQEDSSDGSIKPRKKGVVDSGSAQFAEQQ